MQLQTAPTPSSWRLVGAQVLAYLVTVLAILVMFFFISTALGYLLDPKVWHDFPYVSQVLIAVVLLFSGIILAALQRSALRKWLPASKRWLLVGGIAMPVCLLLETWLLARFFLRLPALGAYLQNNYAVWYKVQSVVGCWSLAAGLIVGLPGGLLFGLAQGYLLPWHRRLWLGLSALAWALIAGLLLWVTNMLAVVLSGL